MSLEQKKSGILITVEGIDGSGKSSIASALYDELQSRNINVLLTREPGATPLGKHIRSLLHERPFSLCPQAEFLLFVADRAQHMVDIIEPSLRKGTLVISDRMADSSLAYQGFGRGLDKTMITTLNSWVMNNRMPDVTIYLKVDYETAHKRLQLRNKTLTAFEQEQKMFFDRVIEGFDTLFKERSNVIIIDGTQSLEKVKQEALERLLTVLSKSAPSALEQDTHYTKLTLL